MEIGGDVKITIPTEQLVFRKEKENSGDGRCQIPIHEVIMLR
jgi:hypothetical protein